MLPQTADYILPADAELNPARPEGATYYNERQQAMIMRQVGADEPTHVFTGFNAGKSLGYPDWALGAIYDCLHDQTGEDLGEFEVVGRILFATGEREGIIPDAPLQHCVFK
jgi:hypothetical protein